jgi:hypothetical protein
MEQKFKIFLMKYVKIIIIIHFALIIFQMDFIAVILIINNLMFAIQIVIHAKIKRLVEVQIAYLVKITKN